MIIQDTSGRFFQVTETGDTRLAHVWFGYEVKPNSMGRVTISGGNWVPTKNSRTQMVRKAATRIVEA